MALDATPPFTTPRKAPPNRKWRRRRDDDAGSENPTHRKKNGADDAEKKRKQRRTPPEIAKSYRVTPRVFQDILKNSILNAYLKTLLFFPAGVSEAQADL